MCGRLCVCVPPWYITKPTRSTQPCVPVGSLNQVLALTGGGKDVDVTSAGWQITLCDPIWHASSHSGEACCKLIYLFTLLLRITVYTLCQCVHVMYTPACVHSSPHEVHLLASSAVLQERTLLVQVLPSAPSRPCCRRTAASDVISPPWHFIKLTYSIRTHGINQYHQRNIYSNHHHRHFHRKAVRQFSITAFLSSVLAVWICTQSVSKHCSVNITNCRCGDEDEIKYKNLIN